MQSTEAVSVSLTVSFSSFLRGSVFNSRNLMSFRSCSQMDSDSSYKNCLKNIKTNTDDYCEATKYFLRFLIQSPQNDTNATAIKRGECLFTLSTNSVPCVGSGYLH